MGWSGRAEQQHGLVAQARTTIAGGGALCLSLQDCDMEMSPNVNEYSQNSGQLQEPLT